MAVDLSAVIILIAGVDVTAFGRVGTLRIDDVLNDAPNTAAFTIVFAPRRGPLTSAPFYAGAFDAGAFFTAPNPYSPVLTPPPILPGAPVKIYLGAIDPTRQIFGGQVLTRDQWHEFDQPAHVRYDVACIDYTRILNHRLAVLAYGQQAADAIVVDLIARYAPTITTNAVQKGLPSVTGGITFTFEEISRALSRIAEKIGAYWYVDDAGDLHFFTGTESGTAPAPIVPDADFAHLKIVSDLSQVRTRVIVEGDGATALLTLPAGDAILPVSQTTPFNPAGGRAKVGASIVTYTGTHPGGTKTNTVGVGSGPGAPPTAPTAPTAALAPVKGNVGQGPYQYAVTFELTTGARSDLGAPSAPISVPVLAGPGSISIAVPLAPIKGPIMPNVSVEYGVTFVNQYGAETSPPQTSNALIGRVVSVPAGTGPLNASVGGTAIGPGTTYYAIAYLTAAGETMTTQAYILNSTGGLVNVTLAALPISSDARVTGRRIYRSSTDPANGPSPLLPWHHVIDIPNNTTGNYYDQTPVAQLATRNLPQYDASMVPEGIDVTIPTSADARVTRRRIYRRETQVGGGAYGPLRLVIEIPDNVTTTYRDQAAPGSAGALAPMGGTAITEGAIDISNIPLGPAGTARRRIFRTLSGGSQFRELATLSNNTATTYRDTEADSTLGGSPLPPQGDAGTSAPPTIAGSPTLQIESSDFFPAAGWASVESQVFRYTGIVGGSPGPYLTGIPATGPGALTADVPVGSVVTTAPALVGVSPVVPVTFGDGVQLLVQVDDVPAQTALAAIEGGDGVIEHYIQDRRLSETGATARALAELALFKTIETRLFYTTHDPNTRSGRTVHVALPAPTNCTGDFLIQRVTIDGAGIAKSWYPVRAVEASTTRFSFEDVLNRILMESL